MFFGLKLIFSNLTTVVMITFLFGYLQSAHPKALEEYMAFSESLFSEGYVGSYVASAGRELAKLE